MGLEPGPSRMGMGLRSKKMDVLGWEKLHEQRCGWGGQQFLGVLRPLEGDLQVAHLDLGSGLCENA